MLITTGESGQLGSSHYTDQFSYWFEGKADFVCRLAMRRKIRQRKHTLILKPVN